MSKLNMIKNRDRILDELCDTLYKWAVNPTKVNYRHIVLLESDSYEGLYSIYFIETRDRVIYPENGGEVVESYAPAYWLKLPAPPETIDFDGTRYVRVSFDMDIDGIRYEAERILTQFERR